MSEHGSTASVRDRIVAAVRAYQAEHGYPPSLADLRAALGFASRQSVANHLRELEAAGRVRRDAGRARSVVVVDEAPRRRRRRRA